MSIRFYPRSAGLIEIVVGDFAIHFIIPSRGHWVWGHKSEEYDRVCEYYGLGPLGMVVVLNW